MSVECDGLGVAACGVRWAWRPCASVGVGVPAGVGWLLGGAG